MHRPIHPCARSRRARILPRHLSLRRLDCVSIGAMRSRFRPFMGVSGNRTQLTEWIVQDRCRVVSVLGVGGIGKSALSVHLMHQVAENFEVVIWRSLRDVTHLRSIAG